MRLKGIPLLMLLLLLAQLLSLGSSRANVGALQCLRGARSKGLTVCLSCHDGSLASNFRLSPSPAAQASPCGEHPVPVSYLNAYARQPAEFVAPGRLDPQIQLVEGEVQCITCHTTDANGNWLPLKLPGDRPFCLSCHRK